MIVGAGFAFAVLLTLGLSVAAQDSHIRSAAILLTVMWLLSGIADYTSVGDGKFFPAMDGLACALCTLVWTQKPKAWLFLLAVSFLAMTALHASYFTSGDFSYSGRYAYDFRLNLLCAAQLALVSGAASISLWRLAVLREAWGG